MKRNKARADALARAKRELRIMAAGGELRVMPQGSIRGPFEFRTSEDGSTHDFEGYAAVFNVTYEVEDWLGTYTETVMPGAFTKTLAERDDVRFLINHQDLPLARTKSGTLQLSQDDIGLKVQATLDATDPDVQRVAPKMARGDLAEMSHAFRATRQEWDEDYTDRKLIEEKLYDVSIVTYPASPTTSAALRGIHLLDALAEADPQEILTQVRSLDAVAARAEVMAGLRGAMTVVTQLLQPRKAQARQEPDGEDEPAEEAEEISDLMVLKGQLDAATMLVDQMLAEEAEDEPAAGAATQTNSARDAGAIVQIEEAQRGLLLQSPR